MLNPDSEKPWVLKIMMDELYELNNTLLHWSRGYIELHDFTIWNNYGISIIHNELYYTDLYNG